MTAIRRRFLAACAALALAPRAFAQGNPAYRGVYARINMAPAQDMIRRLAAEYGSDRRLAIQEVLGRPSAVMPPVLYALANAFAEDYAERAIFWYHVGRLRAVYDALRCRDKTAQSALLALRKQLGPPLVRDQFQRRDRLPGIARKAVEWDLGNGRDYDQRWPALWGEVAKASPGDDADEIQVPEAEWPAILRHVHESHLKSVQDFVDMKRAGS